jgi:hypothetical protein
MADTNSQHAGAAQTEGDGISYRGIVVFMVILVATTVLCELIVVGMYKAFDSQSRAASVARAPLAAPALTLPPGPNLLTNESANLHDFRAREMNELTTYGWMDKNAGTVRLPIDRAMELVLERGLPVRGADAAPQMNTETAPKTGATPGAAPAGVKK